MGSLCRAAYAKRNIPRTLTCKFERRTNDYQRSYRMGVLSKDLDKMREEIKTHRDMKDYHHRFVKSKLADGESDTHVLDRRSIARLLPQQHRAASLSLSVPVFPRPFPPVCLPSLGVTYKPCTILPDAFTY